MTTLTTTRRRSFLCFGKEPRAQTASAAFGGDGEPALVYVAANVAEADLVIALLASENIPAYAAGASLSQAFGLQVGPLAEVRVFVARGLASRARQTIAAAHADEDQPDHTEGDD
jgi:hypothetical protein